MMIDVESTRFAGRPPTRMAKGAGSARMARTRVSPDEDSALPLGMTEYQTPALPLNCAR